MKYLVSLYIWTVGGLYFVCICFIIIFLTLFLKPETFDPFLKNSFKLLFQLKNKDSWVILPRPITIRFGRPISSEAIEKLSKEDLNSQIHDQISALIDPIL